MKLPEDLICGPLPEGHQSYDNDDDFVVKLVDKMHNMHELARETLQRQLKYYKSVSDIEANQTKYQVSDLVWAFDKTARFLRSTKLVSGYKGPYKILKCIGDVTYLLQKVKNAPGFPVIASATPIMRHHNYLKKFHTLEPEINQNQAVITFSDPSDGGSDAESADSDNDDGAQVMFE